jgi:hypothetical protein
LVGGSGGGAGGNVGGNGGGGGIEIGATNAVTLAATSSILACGGDGVSGVPRSAGGGGAGGGILVHGFNLTSAVALNADGGTAGNNIRGGGGGGGGRIPLAYNLNGSFTDTESHSVQDGLKGSGAGSSNGQDGTFDVIAAPGTGGASTESFTGTAVWSDGFVTPLVIDPHNCVFTTSRSFPDDHPATGTPSDDFTVDITIQDDDGGSVTETSPVVTVSNVAPIVNLEPVAMTSSWEEMARTN